MANFASNTLDRFIQFTYHPSRSTLLTFQTNFNMYPTKPFSPSPPEIFIVCKKRPTSSEPELSAGNWLLLLGKLATHEHASLSWAWWWCDELVDGRMEESWSPSRGIRICLGKMSVSESLSRVSGCRFRTRRGREGGGGRGLRKSKFFLERLSLWRGVGPL